MVGFCLIFYMFFCDDVFGILCEWVFKLKFGYGLINLDMGVVNLDLYLGWIKVYVDVVKVCGVYIFMGGDVIIDLDIGKGWFF